MKNVFWSALWRSNNKLHGKQESLIYRNRIVVLFRTRQEARNFINKEYGYIKQDAILMAEPHGWKIPIPIRVIIKREIDEGWQA
jgi:hypothetical protein